MNTKLLITAIGILNFTLVFSQRSINDTIPVDEVVITGNKTPQSKGNVTQTIDIVNAYEMEQVVSNNRNISEIIRYKPGASVTALSRNDANWGTYGGIGPKYSTYMLQGLPVDAFVDPMSLDISAVKQIEIQRGPASVLYPNYLSQDFAGNQSPLAGTINLILKDKITEPLTRISTSYGSYHTLNGQLYHEANAGNISYFAGATHENSDYTNYGTSPSWLNMKKDPEYTKNKLFVGATWYPKGNDHQKVSLFIHKTLHKGDAGRVYRGFDHQYGTINVGYSSRVNHFTTLQVKIGMRSYDRRWQESNYGEVDTLKSTNGVIQHILPADLSLTFKPWKNHTLTAGSDYQGAEYTTWSDPLVGYRSYGNKSNATQNGIFLQEEYSLNQLILRGGLRYNYITHHIHLIDGNTPGQSSQSWDKFLWSAGVRYHINPNISLFSNAGNSFQTPGLKATGGTIKLSDKGVVGHNGQLPNPDLKPESGIGFDAGTDLKYHQALSVSIRGFYYSITDAILDQVVSNIPSQTQSVNAGETSSFGAEIDAKVTVNWISMFTNFTYMKSQVKNGGTVAFSPEWVANGGVNAKFPFGLTLTPTLNYNPGFYDSSDKHNRSFFKPGALVNIYVSQTISMSDNHKIELFGQFYNVTDNHFKMPWQFQDPGYSMMIGIRTSL